MDSGTICILRGLLHNQRRLLDLPISKKEDSLLTEAIEGDCLRGFHRIQDIGTATVSLEIAYLGNGFGDIIGIIGDHFATIYLHELMLGSKADNAKLRVKWHTS